MATRHHPLRQVWMFLAVTYGFSWLFWIPAALSARGVTFSSSLTDFLNGPLNPAAFGPSLAALALTWQHEGWRGALGLLRQGLDFRFGWRWLTIILIGPLIIFGGSIIVATSISGRTIDTFSHQRPALCADRVLRHPLHQRAIVRRIWLARLGLATLASALWHDDRELDHWRSVVVVACAGSLHSRPVHGQ